MNDWINKEAQQEQEELDRILKLLADNPELDAGVTRLIRQRPKEDLLAIWAVVEKLRKSDDYCVSHDAEEIYQKFKDMVEEQIK